MQPAPLHLGGGGGSAYRYYSKTFHTKLGLSRDACLLWRKTTNSGTMQPVGADNGGAVHADEFS
jgi:hypothetical protein